jgi:hypothetical protein
MGEGLEITGGALAIFPISIKKFGATSTTFLYLY